MRIYMDNCCYNRILDDRSHSQIYFERNSVMLILELAEQKEITLVGSQILKMEMSETGDLYKKQVLQMLYSLCSEEINVTREILARAEYVRRISNIKFKDSIHLACAEKANVDVMLTTD